MPEIQLPRGCCKLYNIPVIVAMAAMDPLTTKIVVTVDVQLVGLAGWTPQVGRKRSTSSGEFEQVCYTLPGVESAQGGDFKHVHDHP